MSAKRALPILLPVLIVAGLLAVVGCARRPAMTQASAPPPTGMAATTPPPSSLSSPSSSEESPAAAAAPAPQPSVPAASALPSPKDFADVAGLPDIHFDYDKANIRPDAAQTLNASASWLRSNGNTLVLVEGHCDERGTNEYNLALGERRAKAAINYLIAQGVASDRFTRVSYGEERPICTEHHEACWAKNRRDHFRVKER